MGNPGDSDFKRSSAEGYDNFGKPDFPDQANDWAVVMPVHGYRAIGSSRILNGNLSHSARDLVVVSPPNVRSGKTREVRGGYHGNEIIPSRPSATAEPSRKLCSFASCRDLRDDDVFLDDVIRDDGRYGNRYRGEANGGGFHGNGHDPRRFSDTDRDGDYIPRTTKPSVEDRINPDFQRRENGRGDDRSEGKRRSRDVAAPPAGCGGEPGISRGGAVQTPSPSDSGVGELEAVLREREAELARLRETMERNETAIMQVGVRSS